MYYDVLTYLYCSFLCPQRKERKETLGMELHSLNNCTAQSETVKLAKFGVSHPNKLFTPPRSDNDGFVIISPTLFAHYVISRTLKF